MAWQQKQRGNTNSTSKHSKGTRTGSLLMCEQECAPARCARRRKDANIRQRLSVDHCLDTSGLKWPQVWWHPESCRSVWSVGENIRSSIKASRCNASVAPPPAAPPNFGTQHYPHYLWLQLYQTAQGTAPALVTGHSRRVSQSCRKGSAPRLSRGSHGE